MLILMCFFSLCSFGKKIQKVDPFLFTVQMNFGREIFAKFGKKRHIPCT